MKYLYIKYMGNKRSTVLSNGTNVVLKLDTVPVVATTSIVNAVIECPTIMCASAISANHDIALDLYRKGCVDEYYYC